MTLARRHNLLVLSDDVYQLLPFPGVTPPPRLVSYDLAMGAAAPGGKSHVLSNGSFSKLIGPGVRLGWLEAGPGEQSKMDEFLLRMLMHFVLRNDDSCTTCVLRDHGAAAQLGRDGVVRLDESPDLWDHG